ncbi:hypothetical protein IT400_02690 [Candidatus Nomurabacteria bacterium]|nr:hypothetical protein [Candidatus Nomurabacteria bacterium]
MGFEQSNMDMHGNPKIPEGVYSTNEEQKIPTEEILFPDADKAHEEQTGGAGSTFEASVEKLDIEKDFFKNHQV